MFAAAVEVELAILLIGELEFPDAWKQSKLSERHQIRTNSMHEVEGNEGGGLAQSRNAN